MRPVAHTFSFRTKHSYDMRRVGITVPVEPTEGANVVQVDARLDTGTSFYIFERAYGEMLDLNVEGSARAFVSTANILPGQCRPGA